MMGGNSSRLTARDRLIASDISLLHFFVSNYEINISVFWGLWVQIKCLLKLAVFAKGGGVRSQTSNIDGRIIKHRVFHRGTLYAIITSLDAGRDRHMAEPAICSCSSLKAATLPLESLHNSTVEDKLPFALNPTNVCSIAISDHIWN